jgi:hypothetical protein
MTETFIDCWINRRLDAVSAASHRRPGIRRAAFFSEINPESEKSGRWWLAADSLAEI